MKRIREDFSTILRSLAQAPTCVLYCNLQYILGVAPSRKEAHRVGRGALKIAEKSFENLLKILNNSFTKAPKTVLDDKNHIESHF